MPFKGFSIAVYPKSDFSKGKYKKMVIDLYNYISKATNATLDDLASNTKIRKETGVISGFGEVFASLCTDRGAFFDFP